MADSPLPLRARRALPHADELRNIRRSTKLICLYLVPVLAVCRSAMAEKPIEPVSHVNLARYMGRWYVIGSIPCG